MIINRKILILDLLLLLFSFILYGNSFDFWLVISYFIYNLFRVVYRKFFQFHKWPEVTNLIIRIILLLYFLNRGFLGFHQMLFISYWGIKIIYSLLIMESLYYLIMTIIQKRKFAKSLLDSNIDIEKIDNELEIENSKSYDDEHNFVLKRSDRYSNEEIELEEKIEIQDFHGMKVKVLNESQRKKYLKKVAK